MFEDFSKNNTTKSKFVRRRDPLLTELSEAERRILLAKESEHDSSQSE